MQTLAPIQFVLIAAGVLVGVAAVWFLLKARAAGRRLRFEGEEPSGWAGLTFPTQVCIGFVGLLAAYHLIVWAFPPSMTTVQLTRDRWWVWVGLAVGACGLSVLLDRMDRSDK